MTELKSLKELILMKLINERNVKSANTTILTIVVSDLKKNCNRCDWGIKPFGKFAVIYVNDFSFRFFMFGMTEEDVIEFRKGFEPCDEFQTMLQYERTDISEGIDIDKTNASKECMLSH